MGRFSTSKCTYLPTYLSHRTTLSLTINQYVTYQLFNQTIRFVWAVNCPSWRRMFCFCFFISKTKFESFYTPPSTLQPNQVQGE